MELTTIPLPTLITPLLAIVSVVSLILYTEVAFFVYGLTEGFDEALTKSNRLPTAARVILSSIWLFCATVILLVLLGISFFEVRDRGRRLTSEKEKKKKEKEKEEKMHREEEERQVEYKNGW